MENVKSQHALRTRPASAAASQPIDTPTVVQTARRPGDGRHRRPDMAAALDLPPPRYCRYRPGIGMPARSPNVTGWPGWLT